ncbi:glycosyltransferase family 4 protein [Aeoliella sp. ICT_H6.2]|uniref:Glycosyltransferase family 4 protein n=1 Tax=Aeoliella straminimaris TaxID=2954799 RepID=A0A9X2JEU5_9BACT|nr:glycosyltransferase family 4 protein [Aeoliella straminimaris]MCO6043031.1 glycosyltransferase family 4 protein [Aeoliella straminimaris]
MSQRILHVIQSLERYTPADELLTLLPTLAALECQQSVLVLGRGGALAGAFAEAGVELRCLEQRWTFDPSIIGQLVMHVRRTSPEVVHTWDRLSRRYVSAAAASSRGWRFVANWSSMEPARLRIGMPMFFPRTPDRWLVESESVRESLSRQLTDSAIAVVPPAAAPATSDATRRGELLAEFGLPDDALLIGTAGQLVVPLGIKELIWAVDMVRVLHPNIRLLIAGDGPQRDHLQHFAATAAVPENICFLGDTDRWCDIVPHLDVYWQGTEVQAISPTALLTAMSAGVPVVASDTPQHREWIEDNQNGFLVGYDARADRTRITDQLLVDAELRQTIGEAARQHFHEHYMPAARAEQLADIYRQAKL